MHICVKCRREMTCKKTGATAHFGFGHCYGGDVFECKECGNQFMITSCMSHKRWPLEEKKGDLIIDMEGEMGSK